MFALMLWCLLVAGFWLVVARQAVRHEDYLAKRWHWIIPVIPAVLVTENSAHIYASMKYRDFSIGEAYERIMSSVCSWAASHMLIAFRVVPFAIIALLCSLLALAICRKWLVLPILGGWTGTLLMTFPAMVSVWRPLFTDERVSSTAAIAFLFIPFYAIPRAVGGFVAGMLCSLLVYGVCRLYFICAPRRRPDSVTLFHWPAWTASTYLDEDAVFHWVFQVWGPPRKEAPQHAILTGEDTAAGGYSVPNVLYELRESRGYERDWMLNLSQAQEVATQCITKYQDQRASRLTSTPE